MKTVIGFLVMFLCSPVVAFALNVAKEGPNKNLMECFSNSQIGGFSSISRGIVSSSIDGFEWHLKSIKMTSIGISSPYLDKRSMLQMNRAFCSCEKANIVGNVLMKARKAIFESELRKQIDEKEPFLGEKIKLRDLTCVDHLI